MTVTLMRGSDLIGRTVVDASTGNDLAEIKNDTSAVWPEVPMMQATYKKSK